MIVMAGIDELMAMVGGNEDIIASLAVVMTSMVAMTIVTRMGNGV